MKIQELRIDHIIIGSGASGFQTARRLWQKGERSVAVITENRKAGTSRNTGSDKQTYYKLSLAGDDKDSVLMMAEDLFAGGCVDGDQALCEAALSVESFFNLVSLGVPFPNTRYGEYMGYKTDHDRGKRATSAGPYTSKMITECLEKDVKEKGICILDHLQALKIMVKNGRAYGVLCLDRRNHHEISYKLIWCKNIVLATGGPAAIYYNSVYPASQLGTSGMAFEAGAKGKNLTEWQFGMASLKPRWNVSGTYMQVIPRFISTDNHGNDEKEFLLEYFDTKEAMMSMIFLKGYQWPFDVDKAFGGSSLIDLLVYQETIVKGRKVYLDFTRNTGGEICFDKLIPEAEEYLRKADAKKGTPIERLEHMNILAVDFYMEHGIDLHRDKLEIAICAQHNNGGIATTSDWETNIAGLYAVGEVCGSHGINRPGGAALNAGQVGAIRAADKIHLDKPDVYDPKIEKELRTDAGEWINMLQKCSGKETLASVWIKASKRMSKSGGIVRNKMEMESALEEIRWTLEHYTQVIRQPSVSQFSMFYHLRDLLIAQFVYLSAMIDYCNQGVGSRGSALYTDLKGNAPDKSLSSMYKCRLDKGAYSDLVQEITFEGDQCRSEWRKVRKIPQIDYFFEKQWKLYRDRHAI